MLEGSYYSFAVKTERCIKLRHVGNCVGSSGIHTLIQDRGDVRRKDLVLGCSGLQGVFQNGIKIQMTSVHWEWPVKEKTQSAIRHGMFFHLFKSI